MQVSLHIVRFDADAWADIPSTLTAVGEICDAGGVSTVSVMDHWFQIDSIAPMASPMLESYSTLAFLAGRTTHAPTPSVGHPA